MRKLQKELFDSQGKPSDGIKILMRFIQAVLERKKKYVFGCFSYWPSFEEINFSDNYNYCNNLKNVLYKCIYQYFLQFYLIKSY